MKKSEIKDYLDECIRHWRGVRDSDCDSLDAQVSMAIYYIDAFQSMRITIFGETLP
jgi:hypothetical protein